MVSNTLTIKLYISKIQLCHDNTIRYEAVVNKKPQGANTNQSGEKNANARLKKHGKKYMKALSNYGFLFF